MKSKTLILSNNDDKRGIITLNIEDQILNCRLRLYGIENLPNSTKIGIYHQDKVFSANLLFKDNVYTSSLAGDFDIDKDFYIALIDTFDDNKPIIAGSTYSGYFENTDVFSSVTPNKYEYDEDCENDCDKCVNCKYKDYFYNNQSKVENKKFIEKQENKLIDNVLQKETEEKDEKLNDNIVLDTSNLNEQFDYIFSHFPMDETLNNLITNSKFVKIDENKDTYSIGAIYEEEKMKYICYAKPTDYNAPVPDELGKHYQWLPLDKDDPLSDGYYIVFQDAKDLKIVEL